MASNMSKWSGSTGILGGLLWVGLALFPPEWGPPGTVGYAHYELWNRLWTPALLGMLIGFIGFFRMVRPSLTRLDTTWQGRNYRLSTWIRSHGYW
jgi:hypothetical protein